MKQLGSQASASMQPFVLKASEKEVFISSVHHLGRENRRVLPWRYLDDPYAVLVSEVMLQQTQVKRVLDYWPRWMSLFPTIDSLASAASSDVLEAWQGLGYNRRALALKRCADICSSDHGGELPLQYELLIELPGIGSATAAGVRAFAGDLPGVYLETNVRSVFLHSFFSQRKSPVADREIIPLIEQTCPDRDVRTWYYDLLDYGAFLKKAFPNPSRKSAGHTRQSAFEGSRRQKRAELVRLVLDEPGSTFDQLRSGLEALETDSGRNAPDVRLVSELVEELEGEGFFSCDAQGCYRA